MAALHQDWMKKAGTMQKPGQYVERAWRNEKGAGETG